MKNLISGFLKNPLFSGSMIMLLGNMFANVVNYIYHVLMGRMLGPVDYGVLASIYSILYLVSIIPASTSVAIVKFIASSKNVTETFAIYKTLERYVFKFALIVSAIIFLSSPFIGRFLKIEDYLSIALVAPILFFSLITLVNQATSQGLTKFFGNVGPNIISSIIKLAFGVGLVFLGWSVFGAMIGVVIALISAYIYSYFFLKRYMKPVAFKKINLKPFFKYTLPVLVQALAFTSIFTIDVVLVKHFLSAFDAGIYAALSTLGKIIFFASSPIAAAMFPIVSKKHAKGETFQKIFHLSLFATVLISLAVVLFYWIFPQVAIGTLYGSAYLSASPDLVWMGLFILFYSLSSFLVNFFLAIGRVKVVIFPLIFSLIQIPLIWIRHKSIFEILQVCVSISALLFLFLVFYLWYYNRQEDKYGYTK